MYSKDVAAAKPYAGAGVYWAPLGSALPTDASTALAAAYVPLGLIGNDGIKPKVELKREPVPDMSGQTVAMLEEAQAQGYDFTLIEYFRESVNKWIYGAANATVTAATVSAGTKTTIQNKGMSPDMCILVFDLAHGDKRMRTVIPYADAVVTEKGPYGPKNLAAFTLNVEIIPDEDEVYTFEYLENDDKTAA